MSESDDIDLPSSQELEKVAKAEDEKRKISPSISSESEKENDNSRSTRKMTHSGILLEVNETERELKYRSKHFKDPDEVITNRKLRCTSCNTSLQSVVLDGRDIYQHPVLKVLMCKSCLEFYGDGNLSIDEDGSGKYCRWCAQGGTLYCCAVCSNAFCKKCIKRNLNRSILVDIESEEWKCFVCDGEPLWELRAICKNAYVVSKKIKRKKREEHERNLKQLQKRREKMPAKKKTRRLNTWQKNSSRASSSSDEDDTEEDSRNKKSKKSKNKRKRPNTSSGSDGGKPGNKKKKQQDSDSDIHLVESEKECIILEDDDKDDDESNKKKSKKSKDDHEEDDDESSKKKCKKSKDDCEEDELPDQVDSEEGKEANELLTEHLKDIIHTGELLAYRAKRLLDKKVSENDSLDPKKVDNVVDSVNLLVKLAGENMQHTVEFLTSQHKHWIKQVKKRYKQTRRKSKIIDSAPETVKKKRKEDISDTNDNDVQDSKSDKHENKSSEDVDVTINGIVNGIESDKEDKKPSKEDEEKMEDIHMDTTMENDTSTLCENMTLDNNTDASEEKEADVVEKQESQPETKKRKTREGDNDSEESEKTVEFIKKEKRLKKKSKATVESDEESTHDVCENGEVESEENNSEAQVKKTKGKDDKDEVASEVSVSKKEEEDKKNADVSIEDSSKVSLLEVSTGSKEQSDESITSLSTVKVGLNNSQVDIFADGDSSFQENNKENIPLEDNKKQLKLEDNEIHEKTTEEADSSGDDAATIELLCSQVSDKDESDIECNFIAGEDSGRHKKQLKKGEEKEDNEEKGDNGEKGDNKKKGDKASKGDSTNEDCDPLALNESDLAVEHKFENTGKKSRKNKQKELVNHKDNAVSDHESEKETSKSKEEDSATGELQLNDNVSEAGSVGSKPEECEDKEADEKDEKEEKKLEDYTDDCFGAQEALLGYTSDDEEDDNEEKRKKKRKKKEKTKRSKDIEEKEKEDTDTKVKPKRRIGPKSKTRQFRSSSSSSATGMESDSSGGTIQKKGENTKKRKFRLKDTEAYKNDKKLGWKCAVDVEKLSESEFQKYYENFYSDEEDEKAKKARDDKEVESLVNLKSLKKVRGKKSEENSDESAVDESDDSEKNKKKRKAKKKKKEQEQRLVDFFNKEDDDSDVVADDVALSGSENDVGKPTKKKSLIEKDNEMAMKMLLASSSDDDELNEDQENELKDEKKKKKKSKMEEKNEDDNAKSDDDIMDVDEEKTEGDKAEEEGIEDTASMKEDMETEAKKEDSEGEEDDGKKDEGEDDKKEEEDDKKKEEEEKGDKKKEEEEEGDKKKEEEEEGDKNKKEEEEDDKEEGAEGDKDKKKKKDDDSDGSDKSIDKTPNKKSWRKDKLLTEKLTDLDTSDEERLWNKKKQKEKKEDSDSDTKRLLKKKLSKSKVKRRILGSDDDDEVFKVPSTSSESESIKSSSDSDVFVVKKKKKKKGKKSDSDVNSDSSSDFKTKKPKRRRIKAPASDSSSNEDDDPNQKSTPGKGRKKIHHIMSDDNVAEATRKAAKEEEERRRRISEKQKLYNELYNKVEGIEKVDKLVLDFDPETKKELVSADSNLVAKLKPHQAQGVKFMWDACFESVKHIKKNKGSGCILAHCMGLGKTFQIVTLIHTLLTHKDTQVHTVLVICPLSTVLNWCNEFNKWLKDGEVNVFELTKYKQNYERQYQLKEWMDCGGVMVLGYEMYRNLTNTQAKRLRKKAIETFQSTLVDPGPDLVVCDEGHILKNEDSAIAKALRRIKTLRRIVLTGTPLQNNLKEYHCMVQFVKPNLLGNRKEFLNRFVNPITNGQFEDSTLHDVKIMKRRAHVLHKMLEASVQRFDYSVLTPFLPPKHEYVVSIRLHEFQVKAYRHYMDFYARGTDNTKGAQLFADFNNLQRIWTHPRVLQMSADREEKKEEKRRLMESDSEGSLREFIDDDDDVTSESSNESSAKSSSNEDSEVQIVGSDNEKKKNKSNKSNKFTRSTRSKGPVEEPKDVEIVEKEDKEAPPPWWKQFIVGDELESIHYSGKLVLLFSILRECEKIGDKVLVFSQSLLSLDLIEHFLAQIDASTQNGESKEELGNHTGSWAVGLDYFRLDGSASSENRHIWCKSFNREDNHRARLFLISTRAGGLGINLYAANRVIIFDASWNPSHDVQSIFRVYRFGQKKPCYIYRFLAQGTMEEKIYDRQVTKLSLSCRVVDEQQIERHYNMADLQELYQFDPEQKTKRPTPILPKDRLLAELIKEQEQWIVTYHEHDSLLENKEEEELNEDERKAAWEEYENEKKGKVITNIPATGQGPNVQALREALRNENPQATPEELEQKVNMIMGQIYDYLSNQQNATPQQKYTAAQLQALQQYQQQQQMRAQREKQIRMQQDLSLRTAVKGYNPATNVSFQQYLHNQKGVAINNPLGNYSNNLYRNPNLDKSGVLRVQSKLVPINPNSPGASRVMVKNFGTQDMGPNHLVGLQPMVLPQGSMYQPPPAHSSTSVLQSLMQGYPVETKEKDLNKKSVPDDVIETIE